MWMQPPSGGEHRLRKRRAVILNADVVGYSAMMAHDAQGTIAALLDNTRWLAQAVMAFGGRVVDAPGDNLMAEFTNEHQAVKCAMYVQWQEAGRNRHLPENQRIRFRIGIDAGEVYGLAGRVYGNAVNIAARLQSAAQTGGLLISEAVAERCSLPGLARTCDYQRRHLKNIPVPVGTLALSCA